MEEKYIGTCRVCLNCDSVIFSKGLLLFEEYNDCVISDKINALANVDIRPGDGLPDRICPTCLRELETAYNFKLKCEKSNALLSAVNNDPIHVKKYDTLLPMKEDGLEDNDIADPDGEKAHPVENYWCDIADSVEEKYLKDDKFGVGLPVEEEMQLPDDDNIEIILPKKEKDLQDSNSDIAHPIIEEYLEDGGFDHEDADDNKITSDLESADIKPAVQLPRESRAVDLKLECHDCGESFKSKCKLSVHWKKVHMSENLKCTRCLKKFKTYAALHSHKKRKLKSCTLASKVRIEGEGRNRVFHCKDCNYQSPKINVFAFHSLIHSGELPFQCDICNTSFRQRNSLTTHKESKHNIYTHRGGTCHYCGKYIQRRSLYNSHIRRHKAENIKYPCKICNSVLKSKETLKDHMQRHSGIKAYACKICPSSFSTRNELYNHTYTVHLKKSKLYKCEICNYTCRSHSSMAKHKPKHSATNIACDICGFFVDNEQQLTLHKKRHTDRNCPCPHCDKTYYSRKNLCNHIREKHRLKKLSSHQPPKINIVMNESSSS